MISVVIPTYNRSELLAEALASVEAQTVRPAEVIVVNNGKDRLSLSLPPNARVVDIMAGAGVAQARNFGALLARGEYLAFLDDDDIWEPAYIEKAQRYLESSPDCLLARLDVLRGSVIQPFKFARAVKVEDIFVRNPGITGSNTIMRRSVFMAMGGYDPSLATSEDKALVLELLLHGYRVTSAADMQAILRHHGGERLTDPGRMVRGVSHFMWKYADRMDSRQILENRIRIAKYRYHQTRRLQDAARFGLLKSVGWIKRKRSRP